MRQFRHSYHVNVVKCRVSYVEATRECLNCRTLVGPPLSLNTSSNTICSNAKSPGGLMVRASD